MLSRATHLRAAAALMVTLLSAAAPPEAVPGPQVRAYGVAFAREP